MKRIPPAFLIAVAMSACFSASQLIAFSGTGPVRSFWSWVIAGSGTSFAYVALVAAGLFELADRSQGPRRRAANLAAWVFVATFVWRIASVVLRYIRVTDDSQAAGTIARWMGSSIGLVAAFSLIAAVFYRRGRVGLAIAALVCVAIGNPIPPLERWYFSQLGNTATGAMLLAADLVTWALVLVSLAYSTDERVEIAADPRRTRRGFELAAHSLGLRLAGLVLALVVVLFAASARSRGSIDVLKAIVFAAPLLGAVSLAMFSYGALVFARNGQRGVTAYVACIAAALAAFVAGALIAQAPWTYGLMYDSVTDRFDYVGDAVVAAATALALVLPIVASMALLAIVIVIVRWSTRRGDRELSTRAGNVAMGYTLLMAINVAAEANVDKAKSVGGAVMIGVVAAIAGLIAVIIVMRLCRAAADTVGDPLSIPTATALPPRD
ncbi:MAG TPA: hypothetical protein VM513_31505 [Kofleriaceae bacterium]|jgi:hypothetical protein|nr:hypothetical protein [Kofleriaceae bacterium]